MKGDINYIKTGNENYITDDKAAIIQQKWKERSIEKVVSSVLKDTDLWVTDLSALPGFGDAVAAHLREIMDKGALQMTEMTVGVYN